MLKSIHPRGPQTAPVYTWRAWLIKWKKLVCFAPGLFNNNWPGSAKSKVFGLLLMMAGPGIWAGVRSGKED